MNPETEEIWPPPPSTVDVDPLSFRTSSVDVSISDDVLTFRLRFIRGFVRLFALFLVLAIPVALASSFFFDYLRAPSNWSAWLAWQLHQLPPFVEAVLGSLALLWFAFEMMLTRGEFRFDRDADQLRAGLWRYSLDGLQYIEIRPQVSKTKTWTRWGFFLGFDRNAASTFDRFNPLHRLVAWYAGVRRNEYYLGYTADPDGAHRAARSIARFLDVEFRGVDDKEAARSK